MDQIQRSIETEASKTNDLQSESGMPLLESLVILNAVKTNPGLTKRELSSNARASLGADSTEDTKFLKYIDNLVRVGCLAKYDFRFHLTPSGERFFSDTRNKVLPALRGLAFR